VIRGGDRWARRALRIVAVALLLAGVPGVLPATAAAAGPAQTTTSEQTTTTAPAGQPDIIPEPNSGEAPDDAGDRGGALQTVIFVVMLLGVVVIGVLVFRESRKARERRGF
jgi:hypothetical protein